MSVHYTGNYTVPGGNGASTITVNFTPTFTYTGGGIYVAYEWASAGPFAANPATYRANLVTGAGLGAASYNNPQPAVNTMTVNDFRPAFVFNAVNTATNEASVVSLNAPGKIASFYNAPHTITALVRNSSINALSNVAVTLGISGANSFSDVQTIPTIAAGGTANVTFAGFNPANNGLNNITVSIPADQNNANNTAAWTQSVTCDLVAIPPVIPAGSYTSQGYGAGANTAGLIYTFKHTPGSNAALKGVNVVVPSFANAQNLGKNLYAVLLDANGAIIATGNTVSITGPSMDVFTSYNFPAPFPSLTAGTDYHIGIGIPTNGYFPVGVTAFTAGTMPGYVSFPTAGGTGTNLSIGYLSLEGVLEFPGLAMTASQSKTATCVKEPFTLTVNSGANTFSWTCSTPSLAPAAGSATAVVITPNALPPLSPSVTLVYNVVGTFTANGCKTPFATINHIVVPCTGLVTNGLEGSDIKFFPNPTASGKSVISGLEGKNNVSIFNLLGEVVLTQNTESETMSIDLSDFASGNYLVKITNDRNETRTVKIINQK
jgi:hypothetical protein